jgi:hypothetical protein
MGSAPCQRRQDRELVICREEGVYRGLREVERAQWPIWNSISARKRAKASHGIPNRCRARQPQLEGVAPESFSVAAEQQNPNGESG